MQPRLPYLSVKPYLWHAVAVTLAVCVLPGAFVVAYAAVGGAPPVLLLVVLGLLVTLVAGGIASLLWSRRPESSEISFGELILWSWWRRRRAEERLESDAELLGVEPDGDGIAPSALDPGTQIDVLQDLTLALETKDAYTHGHSRRVERHVRRTAEELGLSDDQIEELALAATLHDVGKLRVPDAVLRKPAGLTQDERSTVQQHTLVGATLVAAAGDPYLVSAIRHHHERWDGHGYPDALSGRDIPLFARVIAVCDAYDAMASTRPYRASLGHDRALEVLRDAAGTQFDPQVVEAFIATLPARVKIAALIPLWGLPALLRQTAVHTRRLSLQSTSPAVAAVAAAAIVGASLSAPVLPEQSPPALAERDRRSTPVVVDTDDRVLSERLDKRTSKVARTTTSAEPTGSVARAVAPAVAAAPKPAPAPAAPMPARERKPDPEPPAVESPATPPTDPQPQKGRDCIDHPGNGDGEGNTKHCG